MNTFPSRILLSFLIDCKFLGGREAQQQLSSNDAVICLDEDLVVQGPRIQSTSCPQYSKDEESETTGHQSFQDILSIFGSTR